MLLPLLSIAYLSHPTSGPTPDVIHWKCSVASQPWQDRSDIPVVGHPPVPKRSETAVLIDTKRPLQTIDGWGGCFNERGWKALSTLSADDRNEVLRRLFDPTDGLKLNYGRTPIGASDYAIDLYSLNETKGDYEMKRFSIARDRQLLIPYIKAALAIRPDLHLWAVPWSPPSWMKDNGNLVSGHIKDDPQTLDALALYFARYVQEYKKLGVEIETVMPQNEPNISSNYTSCLWTGEQLAKFIGYHLGPTLRGAGLKTNIWLGTLNESSRGGYAYWVGPSVQDPNVRRFLGGVGAQWDGDRDMAETHFLYPKMKLMQTESECGDTNRNDWGFADHQYGLVKKWLNAGANSFMIWNLVLDETGLSTGGWAQCSPIVIDTKRNRVTYTPYYTLFRHFSSYVKPGARLLTTTSAWGDRMAFRNPDGEVVVVMANTDAHDQTVTLNVDGVASGTISLPAHSFNTFTLRGH